MTSISWRPMSNMPLEYHAVAIENRLPDRGTPLPCVAEAGGGRALRVAELVGPARGARKLLRRPDGDRPMILRTLLYIVLLAGLAVRERLARAVRRR
jgi:hypothetical protein